MSTFSWNKLFLFSLFFILSLSVSAQKLDSLQLQELRQQAATCDSIGNKAILKLGGYYYRQKDSINLRYITNREIECAKEQGDKDKLIEGYFHLVLFHQAFLNGDSIIQAANSLLTLIGDDTTSISKKYKVRALIQLGASYYYHKSNTEKAYAYYYQAKDLALRDGNLNQYIEVARDLTKFYTLQAVYSKALNIADEALAKIEQADKSKLSNFLIAGLKFNRAEAITADPLSDSLALSEAHDMYKEYLKYQIDNGRKWGVGLVLTRMLIALEGHAPLDTLLAYGYQSINLNRRNKWEMRDPNLYRHHGKNLVKAGRYKEGLSTLDTAILLAKNRFEWYIIFTDSYDAMVTAHLRLGELAQAEEKFQLYKIYSDSFQIEAQRNAIEPIEAKYQLGQKELENLALKKESERLVARSKFLITIGVLLLLLLALGAYLYRVQQRNARKLSKLNETKNKVFTILAHDLKGPSLIFNNLTKRLSYLMTKKDTNRLSELAEHYEESGQKVSNTINKVLEWAISEKETFANNPEEIELLPLVKDSIQDFEYHLQQKNLRVELDVPTGQSIFFDPNAFAIIHRNLMHNAIKYAPLNSEIKIKYNKQQQSLEYFDCGEGISPKKVQRILNKIPVISEEGTQNETGTGIGLVTCVSLLESNNSSLSFLNLPKGGTKVSIQFAA